MFQSHQYENVRPVSSASHRNVRMEIRPDPSTGDRIPQSAADTQSAKIWPGTEGGQSQAYENVTVTEAAASHPRHLEGDPFEGFEEAIKNSEVISIKKVG